MNSVTPIPFSGDPARIGTNVPSIRPCLTPPSISSCVISSPSRYLVARSSSISAIASISRSRASSNSDSYSAGTSESGSSRLITPASEVSDPIGRCTGTRCLPNLSWRAATTPPKSEFSLSSFDMYTMRGRSRSPARFHIWRVPTSMPACAATSITAASATRIPETTSPR